jgi:hypothetical protein
MRFDDSGPSEVVRERNIRDRVAELSIKEDRTAQEVFWSKPLVDEGASNSTAKWNMSASTQ